MTSNGPDSQSHLLYRAAPGGVATTIAFSQSMRYPELDLDRKEGCIRDKAHAYSQDGGLAVLFGNIAERGCIVKTAGVDESILKFTFPRSYVEKPGSRSRGHFWVTRSSRAMSW